MISIEDDENDKSMSQSIKIQIFHLTKRERETAMAKISEFITKCCIGLVKASGVDF